MQYGIRNPFYSLLFTHYLFLIRMPTRLRGNSSLVKSVAQG